MKNLILELSTMVFFGVLFGVMFAYSLLGGF
jgi:hypothetical protein